MWTYNTMRRCSYGCLSPLRSFSRIKVMRRSTFTSTTWDHESRPFILRHFVPIAVVVNTVALGVSAYLLSVDVQGDIRQAKRTVWGPDKQVQSFSELRHKAVLARCLSLIDLVPKMMREGVCDAIKQGIKSEDVQVRWISCALLLELCQSSSAVTLGKDEQLRTLLRATLTSEIRVEDHLRVIYRFMCQHAEAMATKIQMNSEEFSRDIQTALTHLTGPVGSGASVESISIILYVLTILEVLERTRSSEWTLEDRHVLLAAMFAAERRANPTNFAQIWILEWLARSRCTLDIPESKIHLFVLWILDALRSIVEPVERFWGRNFDLDELMEETVMYEANRRAWIQLVDVYSKNVSTIGMLFDRNIVATLWSISRVDDLSMSLMAVNILNRILEHYTAMFPDDDSIALSQKDELDLSTVEYMLRVFTNVKEWHVVNEEGQFIRDTQEKLRPPPSSEQVQQAFNAALATLNLPASVEQLSSLPPEALEDTTTFYNTIGRPMLVQHFKPNKYSLDSHPITGATESESLESAAERVDKNEVDHRMLHIIETLLSVDPPDWVSEMIPDEWEPIIFSTICAGFGGLLYGGASATMRYQRTNLESKMTRFSYASRIAMRTTLASMLFTMWFNFEGVRDSVRHRFVYRDGDSDGRQLLKTALWSVVDVVVTYGCLRVSPACLVPSLLTLALNTDLPPL